MSVTAKAVYRPHRRSRFTSILLGDSFPGVWRSGAYPGGIREEIRKREERKDRLHQNYLKRKASGAQKRYEDKIKGEEKGRNRSQESRHSCRGHCKGRVRPCQQFTAERADERSANSMNITYTQNGDYLIPNIVIRKTKPIGHYGRLRKAYLEMHRPILFNELVLSDKLFEHCAEIDEAARNRMELIVRSLAKQNGVT